MALGGKYVTDEEKNGEIGKKKAEKGKKMEVKVVKKLDVIKRKVKRGMKSKYW
jgi:hypothetical protein